MIGDRWGVSAAEVGRRFPCDDLLRSPALELWRGVTVHAPADAVWPWLKQLRLAPYSYDWLDNAGRRSPRTLHDLPEPRPGDRFSTVAGRFPVGRVVATRPGTELTAEVAGALMSYVLVPGGDTTRLLLKVVLPRRRWTERALALGDWPMARRQLLNLKHLAETTSPAGEPPRRLRQARPPGATCVGDLDPAQDARVPAPRRAAPRPPGAPP